MSTTTAPRHAASARRAARRTRVQHLVTADETSLPELEALLATLPLCSTGRVFVEVPDATWIGAITAPPRMVVTWLDRSRRTGDPGTGRACAPGQALARAVAAWAGEMLCADEHGTTVFLLGGYLGTADIFDHLTGGLGLAPESVHVPARFGLTAGR